MTRRPLAVLLFGAVLRELLPYLARLADALDPGDTATSAWDMRPIPGERVIVPPAWVEMEAGQ
jgi:hypothetical protein